MDINQDIWMQVCKQIGKLRERMFIGGESSCVEYAEEQAEEHRKSGWIVLHAENTGEWIFEKKGETDFELVIGDSDSVFPEDVQDAGA